MAYPICLTTYERYDYFQRSIESLEKCDIDLSNLHIFDDCSKQPFKLELLKKFEKKYIVHYQEENKGTVLNTIPSIDFLYERFRSDYIIFLQDDVIYSKSCFKKAFKMLEEINSKYLNIAYLCLFNRTNDSKQPYYIMPNGHPGGIAWIINRKAWKDYRETYPMNDYGLDKLGLNDRRNHQKVRNLVDYKLAHRFHILKKGYYIAKVGKSLVQHIGDKSIISNRDMTFIREEGELNFVGEDA